MYVCMPQGPLGTLAACLPQHPGGPMLGRAGPYGVRGMALMDGWGWCTVLHQRRHSLMPALQQPLRAEAPLPG